MITKISEPSKHFWIILRDHLVFLRSRSPHPWLKNEAKLAFLPRRKNIYWRFTDQKRFDNRLLLLLLFCSSCCAASKGSSQQDHVSTMAINSVRFPAWHLWLLTKYWLGKKWKLEHVRIIINKNLSHKNDAVFKLVFFLFFLYDHLSTDSWFMGKLFAFLTSSKIQMSKKVK